MASGFTGVCQRIVCGISIVAFSMSTATDSSRSRGLLGPSVEPQVGASRRPQKDREKLGSCSGFE